MHCNSRPPDVAPRASRSPPIPRLKCVNLSLSDLQRFTTDTLRYAVMIVSSVTWSDSAELLRFKVENFRAVRQLGFYRKLTVKIPQLSGTHNARGYQISSQPGKTYGWVINDVTNFFVQGRRLSSSTYQSKVDQTAPNLRRKELHHCCTKRDTLAGINCFVSKCGLLKDE